MNVELAHRVEGPSDAPAVLLVPSLGTTMTMWDELADTLADRYRVVRFDTRGHGGSPVPDGPYSMDDLTRDVVGLADSLSLDRYALVGLSLGGAIGQTLALTHPERLTALVLACTGPSFGGPDTWRERAARVRAEGMSWLVEPTRGRWFTPEFCETHPERAGRLLDMIANTPPVGYAGCCDALAGFDVTSRLPEIPVPTRVVSGDRDPVSPPEVGSRLADGIPGADLVVIPDVSHIANVAAPEAFAAAVTEHLEKHL